MSLMERTEQALARHFEAACGHGAPPRLVEAMRHAVFSGGARIRPQLCMAVAVACGDDRPELTDAAAVAQDRADAPAATPETAEAEKAAPALEDKQMSAERVKRPYKRRDMQAQP